MTSEHPTAKAIRLARADNETRTRSHVRDCVLLAVVTSEEIAADLIDQAIALNSRVVPPR